ncbi:MAG: alkaline phosphatase family protein [Leptolinea sp.]|jgi:predicted AlkP superfamily pyrophosphatase or phosphodiesterase|nr:alkaline phosphatase family protein [Leptolinea sp.]
MNENDLLARQHRLLSLNDPVSIFPDYSGYSLVNLPDSICNWLGIPGLGNSPLSESFDHRTERYDRVILLLMDGLGWTRLQKWMRDFPGELAAWEHLLKKNHLFPLTSVSPSTTCAALTTLNTGKTPAVHGNLGYELWLQEFGVTANMILHTPMTIRGGAGSLAKCGFKASEFLPVSTLDTHLLAHGVDVQALHPAPIARSSLTEMLFPAASLNAYRSMSDLWYRLREFITTDDHLPAYLFAYWSEIDELSHFYGPEDRRVILAFRDFTRYLTDLLDGISMPGKKKTMLVLSADHGLQASTILPQYDLNRYKEFTDLLQIMPTGENRLPFLHVNPDKQEQVKAYIDEKWPGKFQVISGEAVISSGLFGNGSIYEETKSRIGDLVVFPCKDAYWWWAPKENRLMGRHGGLSRDEMLVPLAFIEC